MLMFHANTVRNTSVCFSVILFTYFHNSLSKKRGLKSLKYKMLHNRTLKLPKVFFKIKALRVLYKMYQFTMILIGLVVKNYD